MNKFLTGLVALIGAVAITASPAFAGPFDSCELETHKDKTTSGRFIWVPKASHFNQAVIVVPRDFFPIIPKVELFTFEGQKIETAKLKSTGQCAGWHECLFAATFLTKHLGTRYQNKYGSVIVKITPGRETAKAPTCRLYQILKPKKRNEYRG
ncbi:MAG: hypothetical protein J0M12_03260 [Deltaproteobacteria bacterium]|nr:hypothetical protein [Deltaproteobacteria bacterium]